MGNTPGKKPLICYRVFGAPQTMFPPKTGNLPAKRDPSGVSLEFMERAALLCYKTETF